MKIRPWAGNLLLLLVSVLIGIGLLEFGARIVITRRPVVTTGEQAVYSQSDPLLGWRNRPKTSVRYSRREYSTEVAFNSLGFRDVERSVAKPPGFGRVLALGDSFIEGYTVELEQSVTRRAEAISLSEGCRLEFLNAGVHGYSTDQEALWFVRDAPPLAADIVIVFAYYNDILHNTRGNYWGSPKPITKVVDGQIVPINLPLPEPSRGGESLGVQTKAPPPIQGLALKGLVMERMIMGTPSLHNWLARAGLVDPYTPDGIPDELRAYKARGHLVEFDAAWESTSAILLALGNTIRARHAVPVLVHIPARFEVSDRDWNLTAIRYGIDPKAWDRGLVSKRLEGIASSGGWAFLDLTVALKSAESLFGGEPYFRYDGHWNRLGHDVVARTVVNFLRERSLLPCGGSTGLQKSTSRAEAHTSGGFVRAK